MLAQSHFIEFNDIKSKSISNAFRDSSVYIINCGSLPVAQELDKIHVYMRAGFVDLLRELVS